MKVNKLLVSAVLGLALTSCGQGVKTKTSLATEKDSVNYALGMDLANNLTKEFKDELDKDVLVQGFLDVVNSKKLLIEKDGSREVLMTYFNKKRQKQMEDAQKKQEEKALTEFADYKKENEQFLAENKTKKGVKTTDSGLQYIVLKEGKGEMPKATSTVKVHYKGTNIKGEEFDSSYKRKEPIEFPLNGVIKGWTEGLQLMKKGGKYKFFIPQELAYGFQQRGEFIKPFSTLIFEVELLDIKDENK